MRYVLRRCVEALIVVLTVVTAVFLLVRLSGNPAQLLAAPDATDAQIQAIAQDLGLSDPIPVQFAHYLLDVARADFGYSFRFKVPVRDLIVHALPYTATLGLAAFAFALLFGLTLGTASAVRSRTWLDGLIRGLALLGQSIPAFWLGMVLVLLFSVHLGLLPAFGPGGPSNLVIPVIALGAFPLASIIRLTRSATLDVLRAEYVLFERSKGVPTRVLFTHILRNASLPVVTMSGIQLGHLLGGAVIVETLFAWPGIGQLALQSVITRDFNVTQGIVIVNAAIFAALNLIVDLSYGWIDPRIRRGGAAANQIQKRGLEEAAAPR